MTKITEQLEYLFIMKIADSLDAKTLDIPSAKELARKFLAIEPFTSFEDARSKVYELTNQYGFLSNMKEYIDGYHEELKKNEVIEKMREHMRAGNIDEALKVAQS